LIADYCSQHRKRLIPQPEPPGRPAACREQTFHHSQPGDALLQKLEAIAFSLDEEERLTLTDVTSRERAGFDVERVTKRFYVRFVVSLCTSDTIKFNLAPPSPKAHSLSRRSWAWISICGARRTEVADGDGSDATGDVTLL
jgi:hypothetical protein